MSGANESDDAEPRPERVPGRPLLVAVLVLAVAATIVLVVTDSARWLRLGVLAGLWAALLGAYLAARYRRQVAAHDDEVAELQAVYETELEREVAARREHELEIEAEARRRVADAHREDMAALRGELRQLRETLERLTGGEVLVERFALRAQSTRMRALGDAPARSLAAGDEPRRAVGARRPGTGTAPRPNSEAATQMMPAATGGRETTARDLYRPVPLRAEPQPSRAVIVPVQADRGDRGDRRQTGWPSAASAAAVTPAPAPATGGSSSPSGWRRAVGDPAPARSKPTPATSGPRGTQVRSRHRSDEVEVVAELADEDLLADDPTPDWQPDQPARPPAAPAPPSVPAASGSGDEPATGSAPPAEGAGAHAAGTSVTELLAAHGVAEASRRRRHRAD